MGHADMIIASIKIQSSVNLAGNPEYEAVIEELRARLPEKDALPAGETKWEGDALDRRIENWLQRDSIPVWLR